jgi:flavorubredoxin
MVREKMTNFAVGFPHNNKIMNKSISSDIVYIGVDDLTLDLFEGQYPVPAGVSYNSYVILGEKVAVMDTVDARCTEQWLSQLHDALAGRLPDYLVVQHMDPDHAASIGQFLSRYPQTQIVATAAAVKMMPLYFEGCDFAGRCLAVKEGDELDLGGHVLHFVMAPMVHWPEVMVTFDSASGVLFSADAFGTFGALSAEQPDDWADEARRYYINIVGKYGAQVQSLLKKAAALPIATICPLHGPTLTGDLQRYIALYDAWSSYRPEQKGTVIAYASIYGNTARAALALADELRAGGQTVETYDLTRDDMARAVGAAFRYDTLVLASATYDASVFPAMQQFLARLQSKNFSNRRVALMDNGSWAPLAAKVMTTALQQMKNIEIVEPAVTIRGAFKSADCEAVKALADKLLS